LAGQTGDSFALMSAKLQLLPRKFYSRRSVQTFT